MRRLFYLVLTIALLYAGYWFAAATAVERGAAAAVDRARAQGWRIAYSDLSTEGFPSRLDTTVSDLSVTTPDGRVEWTAPFVQLLALSYRPNHVIALWPPDQRVTVMGQPVEVVSDRLRASAAVGFSTDVPLQAATVESDALTLSAAGWQVSLGHLLGAVRQAAAGPATYDLWLEVSALRSPALPAALDLLKLDAQVGLSAPLDRRMQGDPQVLSIALHEMRLASGAAAITAAGDLAPDDEGYLAGTLTVAADQWQSLVDLALEAGLLPPERRGLVEGMLRGLARGGDRLEIPLTFAGGQVSAGGIGLIEAPRVR